MYLKLALQVYCRFSSCILMEIKKLCAVYLQLLSAFALQDAVILSQSSENIWLWLSSEIILYFGLLVWSFFFFFKGPMFCLLSRLQWSSLSHLFCLPDLWKGILQNAGPLTATWCRTRGGQHRKGVHCSTAPLTGGGAAAMHTVVVVWVRGGQVGGQGGEEDQPPVLTVKHGHPGTFNKPCVSRTGGKVVTRHHNTASWPPTAPYWISLTTHYYHFINKAFFFFFLKEEIMKTIARPFFFDLHSKKKNKSVGTDQLF